MVVVEKRDNNSWERGRQGSRNPKKIRGPEAYPLLNHDMEMGTVELDLLYTNRMLKVNLHNARNVAGKRSQDTYAQVFLIDEHTGPTWHENQTVLFEDGNEQTSVNSKNLSPDFNHKFTFEENSTKLMDLKTKLLVISIWDQDSSSKDDFMAGITIPLRNITRFKKFQNVTVYLTCQAMNGYPRRLDRFWTTGTVVDGWASCFGGLHPILTNSWDLKECNNRLVSYIDKARVLKQAYEMRASLAAAGRLTDTQSIVITQTNDFLTDQMQKLLAMKADAQRRRVSAEERRRKAAEECNRNKMRYENQMTVLRERMASLDAVALEYSKLKCRECSSSSLVEYYGMSHKRGHVGHHPAAVHAEKLGLVQLDLRAIGIGDNSRSESYEDLIIKIRTEYHDRFLAKLMEARGRYMEKSKLEIHIEEDIMKLYHTLVQQRSQMHGVRYSLTMLRELMNTRRYEDRKQQLRADIAGLNGQLNNRQMEAERYRAAWERELHEVEVALKNALERLREVMGRIAGARVSKETVLDEVAIMQQLLDFEQVRAKAPSHSHKVSVRKSTSRRSASASVATGAYSRSSYSSSSTVKGGYSSHSRKRDSSADSGKGYSKAATPDGTLDSSMTTFTYGGERTSRSSRSSRTSQFLDDLKGDI